MEGSSSRTMGREVRLTSNFFKFLVLPIDTVYGYFIEYTPEVNIENKDLRKFLLCQARSDINAQLGSHFYYDYIITTTKKEEPFSVTCKGKDSTEYLLAIRFVKAIEPGSDHFCWYLNILIKLQQKNLGLKQLTNKPTFFNSDQAIDLPNIGLSIWNGYKATINTISSRQLLCMDICSKIINTKNVLDAIEEVKERNPDLRRKKITDMLYNKIVMTMYNKRFYRIMSIDFESDPTSTFETKEGTISIRDYYLKQYQIKIKDNRQPLLIAVQRGNELKIVPELCFLTGVPEFAKRNGNMMRQVRDANKSNPADRYVAITKHLEKMSAEGRPLAEKQNLIVDPQPIGIKAIEFNPIKIQFKNESVDCNDRGFNIRSVIKNPAPIKLLRICYSSHDYNNASHLETVIQSRMKGSGIPLEKIDYFEYTSASQLCQHMEGLRGVPDAPKILLIILLRRDKTYDDVKQVSVSIEIPIQCILSSQFNNDRKIESILTNVAHQIAAKTGSQLWTVPHCEGIPRITMVVGMDVYHDTVNKKESILAFSASLNPEFTKYYSTIRKQSKIGEEISNAAEGCFHEALVTFFEETKKRFLPSVIIVFRDGVGDSQINIVKDIEISGLRRVISKFQGYNPEIVYMVVMKRIDQRFFLNLQGSMGNPRAGTYVTDPQMCDESTYYLITSSVNQGTATPVKYKIIENTSSITKDALAKFSYALSHLYYNWKGSIKLPCPTQLSHKLAYMVGENVHKDALPNLRKSLWFL
jgi:aubergine